jgi:drug/metabolite transporter (DMT)-like permease
VSRGAKVWFALWTVYIIWGSTYLGIELTVETIPPIFAVAVRFVIAGSLIAGFVGWRRGFRTLRVRPVELASAVLVGVLLPGSNGLLFIAERTVPTGLASLIIASVPLWVVVFRLVGRDRLPWPALAIVVGRDAALVLGSKVAIDRGYDFHVSMLGKLATWLLYAGVAFLIVTHRSTEWPYWIFWAGLILAVLAGIAYAVRAWREVRR